MKLGEGCSSVDVMIEDAILDVGAALLVLCVIVLASEVVIP